MIELGIVEGDLLDSNARAILLPIDGALPSNPDLALVQRSLGRIARAFAHRFPECDLAEEIDAQVTFPVPLGQVAAVELADGSPFRVALLLSMLPHHADQTSDERVRSAIAAAFAQAIALGDSLALESIATPLLKGGWRITADVAIGLMLKTLASAQVRHPLTIEVRILNEPGAAARMRALARSFAIRER